MTGNWGTVRIGRHYCVFLPVTMVLQLFVFKDSFSLTEGKSEIYLAKVYDVFELLQNNLGGGGGVQMKKPGHDR